jgi:hypothetical protein
MESSLGKGMDMMIIPNRGRVLAVISALALAGGLLTLALLAKPSQAQSNGAVSEQLPIEFTVEASACSGEGIAFKGTIHLVNHFTDRGDGTYHVNSHFNLVGVQGTGLTTGAKYVVPASGSTVEHVVADGQFVFGNTDVNLVIGKGVLPNQVAVARLHYIVDADGTVKVETVNAHFKCQQEPEPEAGSGA